MCLCDGVFVNVFSDVLVYNFVLIQLIKMTSVDYDLDTSGGLMPQIQELIKPPILEDSSKKKKDRERRYRKPGRAINHDSCDNCKEGGDLICCDRCPAAFHLICHDPPLTEDDLPSGDWLCHNCKTSPNMEVSPTSSPPRSENSTSLNGSTSSQDISSCEDQFSDFEEIREMEEEADPYIPVVALKRNMSIQNAVQFQLVPELSCTMQLPGSSKKGKFKEINRFTRYLFSESDTGVVHIPAKLCDICKKSCRRASLVQCDYCPLFHHMDCINPPLTSLPNGRWICPNHSEHFADSRVLTSVSLTERVKLWDRFSGPIQQDAIKVHFLKKVNKRNPSFRRKKRIRRRLKLYIPQAIINLYNTLLPHLPRITDPLIITEVFKCSSSLFPNAMDESNKYMEKLVLLHTDLALHDSPFTSDVKQTPTMSCDSMDCEPPVSESKSIVNTNQSSISQNKVMNGPLCDSSSRNGETECLNCDAKMKCDCHMSDSVCVSSSSFHSISLSSKHTVSKPNNVASNIHVTKNNSLGKNSSCLSNQCSSSNSALQCKPTCGLNSPFSSTNSLRSFSQDKIQSNNCDITAHALKKLYNNIQATLTNSNDFDISKLDENIKNALALQRLEQIFPRKKLKLTDDKISEEVDVEMITEVRGRAVICPIDKKGLAVSMSYRTLNLGLGADMDIYFPNYGYCNYVSPKHASIFYDEVTKYYELINYSPFGTFVDNIYYAADFSDKQKSSPASNSLSSAVRKLAKSSPRCLDLPLPLVSSTKPVMTAKEKQHLRPCQCSISGFNPNENVNVGWEGTALLHHGSFIQCGCLQFVFSITEYGFKIDSLGEKNLLQTTMKKSS